MNMTKHIITRRRMHMYICKTLFSRMCRSSIKLCALLIWASQQVSVHSSRSTWQLPSMLANQIVGTITTTRISMQMNDISTEFGCMSRCYISLCMSWWALAVMIMILKPMTIHKIFWMLTVFKMLVLCLLVEVKGNANTLSTPSWVIKTEVAVQHLKSHAGGFGTKKTKAATNEKCNNLNSWQLPDSWNQSACPHQPSVP